MSSQITIDPRAVRLARMKRNVLTTARLFQTDPLLAGHRYRVAMLTLTYRDGVLWEPSHVRALLNRIKVYLSRLGHKVRYLWVAELTKRGRMHYHVLFWLPKGLTLPKPDKRGWWPHGMTSIEWAKKPVGYLAKYASKGTPDATFPRGARISGSSSLEFSDACCRRWWMLPGWARAAFGPSDDLRRAPAGGWFTRDFEWLPSPYGLCGLPGRRSVTFLQVGELPPPRPDRLVSDPLMLRALSGLGEAAN